MTAPIARLELAIGGRTKFVGDILKAVFGPSKDEEDARKLAEQKADPAGAARQLMDFFGRHQAHQARHARKTKAKPKTT